jgi:hypothetical protein
MTAWIVAMSVTLWLRPVSILLLAEAVVSKAGEDLGLQMGSRTTQKVCQPPMPWSCKPVIKGLQP